MKKIEGLKVDYLVADLGYFDAENQKTALLAHDVAVVTEIKQNTVVPDHCSPQGNPECEQGHALVFDEFDKETHTAWFRGNETKCTACPLQAQMLKFRKQVELAFAQDSNQLTSVMKHKKSADAHNQAC